MTYSDIKAHSATLCSKARGWVKTIECQNNGGQFCHLEAQISTREMFSFWYQIQMGFGVGWDECDSCTDHFSITIGSSLCFGGILLVSAVPSLWWICNSLATLRRQISGFGVDVSLRYSLPPLSIALWFSLSFSLFIALRLRACWSIFLPLYLYVSIMALAHSLSLAPIKGRADRVHHQNEKKQYLDTQGLLFWPGVLKK